MSCARPLLLPAGCINDNRLLYADYEIVAHDDLDTDNLSLLPVHYAALYHADDIGEVYLQVGTHVRTRPDSEYNRHRYRRGQPGCEANSSAHYAETGIANLTTLEQLDASSADQSLEPFRHLSPPHRAQGPSPSGQRCGPRGTVRGKAISDGPAECVVAAALIAPTRAPLTGVCSIQRRVLILRRAQKSHCQGHGADCHGG